MPNTITEVINQCRALLTKYQDSLNQVSTHALPVSFIEYYQQKLIWEFDFFIDSYHSLQKTPITIEQLMIQLKGQNKFEPKVINALAGDENARKWLPYFSGYREATAFFRFYLTSQSITNTKQLFDFAFQDRNGLGDFITAALNKSNKALSISKLNDLICFEHKKNIDLEAKKLDQLIRVTLVDHLLNKYFKEWVPQIEAYVQSHVLVDQINSLKELNSRVQQEATESVLVQLYRTKHIWDNGDVDSFFKDVMKELRQNTLKLDELKKTNSLSMHLNDTKKSIISNATHVHYLLNGKSVPFVKYYSSLTDLSTNHLGIETRPIISGDIAQELIRLVVNYCPNELVMQEGLKLYDHYKEHHNGLLEAYAKRLKQNIDGLFQIPLYAVDSTDTFFKNHFCAHEANLKWLEGLYPEGKELFKKYYSSFNADLKFKIAKFRCTNGFKGYASMIGMDTLSDEFKCGIGHGIPLIPVCVWGGDQVFDLYALLKAYHYNERVHPLTREPYYISDINVHNLAVCQYLNPVYNLKESIKF